MIFTKQTSGDYTCGTKAGNGYIISKTAGGRFTLTAHLTGVTPPYRSKAQTLAACKAEAEGIEANSTPATVEADPVDVATLAQPTQVADRLLTEERTFTTPTADVVAQMVAPVATPAPAAAPAVVTYSDRVCKACGHEQAVATDADFFTCEECGGDTHGGADETAPKPTPKPAPVAPVAPAKPVAPVQAPASMAASIKAEMAPKPYHGTAPHLMVEARAGTGKTTTLVEGLKFMRGLPTRITPSSQQAAVWAALKLSSGAKSVGFVAFNKAIAEELRTKVPAGCDAMTLHGMGFKAVGRAYPKVRVEQWRVRNIIGELLNRDPREVLKTDPVLLQATEELVGLVKLNLMPVEIIDESERAGVYASLQHLCSHYEIALTAEEGGKGYRDQVFDLVPRVIDRCRDVARDGCVDFNDMVWLPVVANLPAFRYDLLLVDEAQDLNRCQQELAKKCGRRLVFCGDRRQAIYGFAGADDESVANLVKCLQATDQGCTVLPLTVTRRCGKAIVAEAQTIVPDFEAHETNVAGRVSHARYSNGGNSSVVTYHGQVQANDLVICRVNAPLVAQCFRFLRMGRKANILGRDIGRGLTSLITKLNANSVPQLVERVGQWLDREEAKERAMKNPSETKLIALQDKADTVLAFTDGMATVDEVLNRINTIFADATGCPGIRLASIHKSKGLEATRVFFLMPKGAACPHPMAKSAWQKKQEYNLLYVGITRAIEELVYVEGGDSDRG